MTLKEFLEKNSAAIEEAAKCKNVDEFKSLAEKVGITFGSEDELQKAFNMVKNQSANELSDNTLNTVSGGIAREYNYNDIYYNHEGKVLVRGKGKKV